MKKKVFDFIFCCFCFLAIYFIFKNNKEVAKVILDAVNLFFKKVFVSLFPMFIINDILICVNVPFYFYKIFNKLFKTIFKTSGICAYVFIMSLVSGTPSNAYILKSLVNNKKITAKEASHYLYFTYFSNPLFLTLILSSLFESTIVLKIILIHYLSNIIIGVLVRKKAPNISNNKIMLENQNIGDSIIKSINKSVTTLLMILGTIVFYMLLTFILTNLFEVNPLLKVLISSFLEITNGLNSLANISLANKLKEIIAVATISFGGLSINTQIKSILEETPIEYKYFLKGRIMQALISAILIIFI